MLSAGCYTVLVWPKRQNTSSGRGATSLSPRKSVRNARYVGVAIVEPPAAEPQAPLLAWRCLAR